MNLDSFKFFQHGQVLDLLAIVLADLFGVRCLGSRLQAGYLSLYGPVSGPSHQRHQGGQCLGTVEQQALDCLGIGLLARSLDGTILLTVTTINLI